MADYMRGVGFFPSDYQIECLHHELQICGKRKVPFEDLVKLFVNHSPFTSENFAIEKSMKALLNQPTDASSNAIDISRSQLVSILTESAEKIDEKDAKFYLNEIFCGKVLDKFPLSEFLHLVQHFGGINNICMGYRSDK